MNNIDRLNREKLNKFKVSEQEKVEIDAYIEKYKEARAAITNAVGKTVCSGYIICPICKKEKLYFSQYANGHIHATCSGKCVEWVE